MQLAIGASEGKLRRALPATLQPRERPDATLAAGERCDGTARTGRRTGGGFVVAALLTATMSTAATAKPVGCPIKGTGKGTDGLSRMQVEVAEGMPGSTIVCHYYDGRTIILQNDAVCRLAPITRSETARRTKIDICEAMQPTDIAQCTAQCGP